MARKRSKNKKRTSKEQPSTSALKKYRGRPKKQEVVEPNPQEKTPKKNILQTSSTSSITPLKGFENEDDYKLFATPKIFDDEITQEPGPLEESKDLFDRLLDPNYQCHFPKNIRTYSNKKKLVQSPPYKILDFENCKNRDDILKWLNDTHNHFGRLTQTQHDNHESNEYSVLSLDMPSVSQVNSSKSNSVKKKKDTKRVTKRKPYKLRARSVDGLIKKNSEGGRNDRRSIAGDTPSMENYCIEEVITDDESPISADTNAKLIVDLMEDEYLNTIEKEFMQQQSESKSDTRKKNHDSSKQIRNLKRTAIYKRQPEKLITLYPAENNNVNSYDFNHVENYFTAAMSRMIDKDCNNDNSSESSMPRNKKQSDVSNQFNLKLKNALDIGNNLCKILQTLSTNKPDVRKELLPMLQELKNIFTLFEEHSEKKLKDTSTQTVNCKFEDKNIQTEPPNRNVDIQIQTENVTCNCQKLQRIGTDDKTPLDISLINERQQVEDHNHDIFTEGLDDLCYFNTEEFLNERNQSNASITATKRARDESPGNDESESQTKRPCNKFIPQNLTIVFESCQDSEEMEESNMPVKAVQNEKTEEFVKVENKVYGFSEETDARLIEACDKIDKESTSNHQSIENHNAITYCDVQNSSNLKKDEAKTLDNNSKQLTGAPKSARRSLFQNDINDIKYPESIFSDTLDVEDIAIDTEPSSTKKTITTENIDVILKEVIDDDSIFDYELDEEVRAAIESTENKRIKILQDVVVKAPDKVPTEQDDKFTQSDIVECTPQKTSLIFPRSRNESFLDITLPPPIQFQDKEASDTENDITLVDTPKLHPIKSENTPKRLPLAPVNKITSTPYTQRRFSESISNLSPISLTGRNRNLGYIEIAQKSAYLPLTVVKKTPSKKNSPSNSATKQNSILNYVRPSQESQQFQKSKSLSWKPFIACTRLSKEQMFAISSLVNKKLAAYSNIFSVKVTHLIVSVDEKKCVRDHTMKYVTAIASGIWVLSFEWIKDCLAKNRIVPEEPYEALDVSGMAGPQQSRLNKSKNRLLKGFRIHVAPPFVSTTRIEIENVVHLLGGKVVASPEDLLDKHGDVCIIITEAQATQDFDVYETWLEVLRVVTVDIEWLCRSVGQYKLLSLHSFVLCSDDSIDELGYPPELTAKVPFSFS